MNRNQHHNASTSYGAQKFGRWLVVGEQQYKHGAKAWPCVCECGTRRIVSQSHLITGRSRSCGCLQREISSQQQRGIRNTLTHGHARPGQRTPTYRSWRAMRQRCERPTDKEFARYGGRGIRVCDRWQSFENFLFDMGERPLNASLDRINSDGNYEPSNCRWATTKEQARNRRNSQFLTIRGVRKPIVEWAEIYSVVPYRTVMGRLRIGWDPERALSAPPLARRERT